jgi:uncharacterized protein YgfB (UPF0149 family)
LNLRRIDRHNARQFSIVTACVRAMINYSDLSELLGQAGADAGAAACHGFLCGQVCALEVPDEGDWTTWLDVRSGDDKVLERFHSELRVMAADIVSKFRAMDYSFQLLLPEGARPLDERVHALGDWCEGFLSGVGLGPAPADLESHCREVLEDLGMICRIGVSGPTGDADEEAFMHVTEYVRMGVMAIFEDLRRESLSEDSPEVLH